MTQRAERHDAGFTLVEAMFAIVILMVGLMAVTNLFIVAGNSTSVGRDTTAAAAVASQVMEELKATPFAAVPATGTTTRQVPGLPPIAVSWTAPNMGAANVKFITVTASATGVLGAGRTTSTFTSVRACTTCGCPTMPPC